jgi:very-short-patch-repair endonuclease
VGLGRAIFVFACQPRWLVVSPGGAGAAGATLAALSDRKLTDVGVRVMRFSDDEVLADTDKVVKAIKDELQQPFERPRIDASR